MYDSSLKDYDWTVTEAAKQTGRSTEWIRRRIRSGELAAKEVAPNVKLYFVSVSAMQAMDAKCFRQNRNKK